MDARNGVADDGCAQVTNMHLLGNIDAAEINRHRICGLHRNDAECW